MAQALVFLALVIVGAVIGNTVGFLLLARRRRGPFDAWVPGQRGQATSSGTCETDDVDYVRGWLEQIADRLKEVGIKFVAFGIMIPAPSDEIHWYFHVADPDSTDDELALMLANVLIEAGAVPD